MVTGVVAAGSAGYLLLTGEGLLGGDVLGHACGGGAPRHTCPRGRARTLLMGRRWLRVPCGRVRGCPEWLGSLKGNALDSVHGEGLGVRTCGVGWWNFHASQERPWLRVPEHGGGSLGISHGRCDGEGTDGKQE